MSRRIDFTLTEEQLAVANRLHSSLDELDQTITSVMTNQNSFNHPNCLRLLDKFRLVA